VGGFRVRICVVVEANQTLNLHEYIAANLKTYAFDRKNPDYPMQITSFDADEVEDVVEQILTTKLTMGERVFEFEREFARYIGRKHAVMVNSGSSANLIASHVLIKPDTETAISSLTWSTTLFPVVQHRSIPVFTDIGDELNVTQKNIDSVFQRNAEVKNVVLTHVLGRPLPPLCLPFDNILEDFCEACGSRVGTKLVGNIGHIATTSFYFGHNMTTIEGGMCVTDDDEYADSLRALRAHGWVREQSAAAKKPIEEEYQHIDPRFLFISEGYNVRPTEIQGTLGSHQLRKLDGFVAAKRRAADYLTAGIGQTDVHSWLQLPHENPDTKCAWLGYPIIVNENAPFTRKQLVDFLESKKIQTRPIIAGNLIEHPMFGTFPARIAEPIVNSRKVMRRGLYIGLHSIYSQEALDYVVESFKSFLESKL
jgi:CDP-6-deoxy-D-xylo-4-hexulose-3-dehydrase